MFPTPSGSRASRSFAYNPIAKGIPEQAWRLNTDTPTSNSEGAGNDPTPTHLGESTEPDVTPDSKNFQFSETFGKYVAYLKSIKRPRVVNSELLDGVDRVSRSIEGYIKLAKSALDQTKI